MRVLTNVPQKSLLFCGTKFPRLDEKVLHEMAGAGNGMFERLWADVYGITLMIWVS